MAGKVGNSARQSVGDSLACRVNKFVFASGRTLVFVQEPAQSVLTFHLQRRAHFKVSIGARPFGGERSKAR
jgi:hypothetical protein